MVEIRSRFAVDDAALSALHARAFGSRDTHTSPWRARLERHSVAWVGAVDGDELVGFVHAVGDGGAHAFVLDTVVDPAYQRRGIGLALVGRLRGDVASVGVTWLHVDFEPHLAAFYAACGFRDTSAGLLRLDDDGPETSTSV
ncbi:GNAT family N-acetyltransferase [Mumia sp. DW29H23]|uniref:GNAT family N-acetyltransferase n=1 Tax=Mumia sp. DW29H23 TaxID=3421241 RepID=UPI003D68D745